jgi:ribosomal protein S15P/S13E
MSQLRNLLRFLIRTVITPQQVLIQRLQLRIDRNNA